MVQIEKVEKIIQTPSELPSNWNKAPLADISEIIMGQSPPSKYYNTDRNGLPFFQGKAEFGDLYPEPVKWCSEPGKVAQKDDILISVRAPVGPTNLAPSECCIGRGLAAIRPRDGIPSKYLLYYLRNIEASIDALGTGTTFKAISGKVLRAIPVPVAPTEQQKRIVAEIEKQFSRLDEAVGNLERVKANLKRYKAAVLKAAVEGKLTEEWRKQHPDVEPASELLKRILAERRAKWNGKGKYKEPKAPDSSSLPLLPKGWTWISGNQLFNWSSGDFLPQRAQRPGEFPIYGGNGIIGYHEHYLVDFPTVVVGRVGAHCGNIYLTQGKAWITDNAIYATLLPTHALLPYLKSALSCANLNQSAGGSGQPFVNQPMLNEVPIALPPFEEQQQIVAEVERRFSIIENLEAAVKANVNRGDRLRDAVLKRAFAGGIVG